MAPPTPPLGDLRLHEESDEDDRQELQAVLGEVDTESQAAVAVGSQDHNQSADAENEQLAQRRAEERGSNDPLTNQQQQLRSRRSVLNGAALQVNDHDEMSVDWSTGPLSISDLDIPAAADEEANTERGEDFADAGVVPSAALVGSESTPKLAAGDRADVLSYSSAWKDTLTDEVDDLTPPLSVFLRTLHALRSPASPTNDCLSGTSSRRPRYTYHEEVSRLVASRLTKELCNNNRAFVRFIFPEFLQPERTNAVHALKLSEMENIEAHGGAVCCRVFRTGEGVYRCRDCALDETVVMCSKCYLASNHEGHDVLFSINAVAGGCCDCGDPEAWKIPLNCPYHIGRKRDLSTGESAGRSYVNLPAKVVDHWRNTLRYILEYVLETLAHSSTFRGGTAVSVEGIVERSQRLTREYGEEVEPVDFVLVLWNDESHTFSEVIDRIFSATGQSYTECNAVAHEVDRLGRAVVSVSRDIGELVVTARQFEAIGLSVSIMSIREAFREDLASFCVLWLHELAIGRRGTGIYPDESGILLRPVFRELICEVLCEEWEAVACVSTGAKRRFSSVSVDNGEAKKVRTKSQSLGSTSLASGDASLAMPKEDAEMQRFPGGRADGVELDAIPIMARDMTAEDDGKTELPSLDVDPGTIDTTTSPDMPGPGCFSIADYILAALESTNHAAFADFRRWVAGPSNREGNGAVVSADVEDEEAMATASPIVEEPQSATSSVGSSAPSPAVQRASRTRCAKLYEEFSASLRIDWLLLFDIKGWKALRITLKQLYIATMLADAEYKRALGIRFARNYVRLVEFCMIEDKEHDLPILNFTVQLFTVPTISLLLTTKYDLLCAIMAIIFTFFTSSSRFTSLTLPDVTVRPTSKRPLECNSVQFYCRRVSSHFFHDLRYVISNPEVRHYVPQHPRHLRGFLDLLALFQGMNRTKLRARTHIEYENDWWINAFHITIHLGRLCRIFCKAYTCVPSTPRLLGAVIKATLRRIELWASDGPSDIIEEPEVSEVREIPRPSPVPAARFFSPADSAPTSQQKLLPMASSTSAEAATTELLPPDMHYVTDAHKRKIPVVCYSLTTQTISLHNPLHWFLGFLVGNVGWLTDEALGGQKDALKRIIFSYALRGTHVSCGFDDLPPCLPFDVDYAAPPFRAVANLLRIFDYPIRALAWIAQVRIGIWVRNGLGVIGQVHHYRDISLRGNAYNQDIFLVQLAFVLFNPEQVLATLIDRFDLMHMFSDKLATHKIYDERQCIGLTEELLSAIISILSERIKPVGGSLEAEIRRSLVHFLALKPLTYSGLQAKVSEELAEDNSFDNVLREVSDFQPASGLSGSGTYRLKDRFFDEVSAYYAGYSRAQRDEAEEVLKERHKRRQEEATRNGTKQAPLLLPTVAPILKGPFRMLSRVFHTRLFVQVVFYVMWRMKQARKSRSEMLIDQSLHLVLMALAEPDVDQPAAGSSSCPGFAHLAYAERHPVLINECERESWTLLKLLMKLAASADFELYHDRIQHAILQIEKKGAEACQKLVREWREVSLQGGTERAINRERELEREAAKARQAKIMADFAAAQQSFQLKHADLYRETQEETSEDEFDESGLTSSKHEDGTASRETEVLSRPFPRGTCIVCQEDTTAAKDKPYGILAFVQGSKMYRVVDAAAPTLFADAVASPDSLDRRHVYEVDMVAAGNLPDMGWPSAYGVPGPFMSACGHLMHVSCFHEYKEAVRARHRLQPHRNHPEDTSKKEFLCPLCNAIGNVLLPVAWAEKKEGLLDKFPDAVGTVDVARSSIRALDDWIDKNAFAHPMASPTPTDSREIYDNGSAAAVAADGDVSMELGNDRGRRRSGGARLREALSSMVQDWFGGRGSSANRSRSRGRVSEDGNFRLAVFRRSYEDLVEVAEAAVGHKNMKDIDGCRLCDLLSYTISCTEAAERGEEPKSQTVSASGSSDNFSAANTSDASAQLEGTWLAGLPRKTLDMLRVVCETLFTYTTLAASDDYAAYERIKAASASRFLLFTYSCGVTRGSASAEAPEDGRVLVAAKPWVHRDAFSLLVKMCMSDVVVGKWGAHRLVLVAFVADIVKTVLAVAESVIPSNSAESDKPDFGKWAKNPRVMSLLAGEYGPPNEDVTALVHFVRWVLESAGYSPPFVETFLTDQVPPRLLFKFVQAHSTPFLRKCAAFLYARFGVTYAGRRAADGAPELERLMHHLAVPPYRVLLAASGDPPRLLCGLRKLVACWLRHHVDHRSASGAAPQRRLRLGYPGVYSLVRLPARLDQLYEASLHVKCPKCRTVPLNPAFCLMCGRVLCTQSHCCMDGDNGECHMHGRACGNEVGLFFIVKKCVIFLKHGNNGTFIHAPYLDEHGECDLELKRGKPQFLVRERYEGLRKLYIKHEIATTIARWMERTIDAGGWQTL